jgi:hypothetical protein
MLPDNTIIAKLFQIEEQPLPFSSVRRKMEIKRREDVYKKYLTREKRKRSLARKKKDLALARIRNKRYRDTKLDKFKVSVKYYEDCERSHWFYLYRRYGKANILTLEEFEEHIAPFFVRGKHWIMRKDLSRKDFFLDNIHLREIKRHES